MSEKRSKYDTDPLDPDFVRGTEPFAGAPTAEAARPVETEDVRGRAPLVTEEATRRFDGPPPGEQFPSSYPSVFVPPVYQPPANTTNNAAGHAGYGAAAPPHAPSAAPPAYGHQAYSRPTARTVPKLGIPENWATILPYAPFYIGLLAALVELLLVPRTEPRTRFHAAQGLALQCIILAASMLFSILVVVTGVGAGGKLISVASFIFLVISMWRVWEGRPHHLAPLDDLTKKINERFEPRK